jgi:glycosyltransferase involved in cell wall biosynthesis
MKILFSAYAVSPARGSEPGNSWRLATGLADRGHEIELVTTGLYEADWPSARETPSCLRVTIVDDTPTVPMRRGHSAIYLRYISFQNRSLRIARDIVASRSIDLIHHYSWGSLFWGSPLWQIGLPTVFGPCGGGSVPDARLRSVLPHRARKFERLRQFAMHSVRVNPRARKTARHSVSIAANSDTMHLLQRLGATSAVIMVPDITPSSLLRDPATPIDKRASTEIVWVGRLLPHKGVTLAIDAMARLPDSITLTVIGDGPEMARARAHARTQGVAGRVNFVGSVPFADVRHYLDRARVFLFTSIRDTFGGQLLEAAARGTPIVAIRQQGVADHVPSEAGDLVSLGSPSEVASELAERLRCLLQDPDRWHRASVAARRWAEQNSLESKIAHFERIYNAAIIGAS